MRPPARPVHGWAGLAWMTTDCAVPGAISKGAVAYATPTPPGSTVKSSRGHIVLAAGHGVETALREGAIGVAKTPTSASRHTMSVLEDWRPPNEADSSQ